MKKSFLIYTDFYDPIKDLSDEELGSLFRAIFEWQINKTECTDKKIKMALMFFVNRFKIDEQKYSKIIERNKLNGKKGGRPRTKKTQENPKNPVGLKKPNETQQNPKNPAKHDTCNMIYDTCNMIHDNDIKKEKNIKRNIFRKPTVQEIHDYMIDYSTEKKISIDFITEPENMFDFYESKGWRVGNAPMKDWKATARNWIKNKDKFSSKNNSQNRGDLIAEAYRREFASCQIGE